MAEWKARTGQKIERLYAWVATEPDGGQGIVASLQGGMWTPMVGADLERMNSLRETADAIHRESGFPVSLMRFDTVSVIEELP